MKTFKVKYVREFEVDIQADNLAIAEALAKKVVAQFPLGACKMLSITETGTDAEAWLEPKGSA